MKLYGLVPLLFKMKKVSYDIKVFLYYHGLKNPCVHHPFPTHFSDEVLDNVAMQEAYLSSRGSLDVINLELYKRIRINHLHH